jgi:division/cell wall cluster transcriptional repressor MraZ
VFYGKDFKVVDGKLRLGVPSKFRKMAEIEGSIEGFFLVVGEGPFIKVYTRSAWMRIKRKIERLGGGIRNEALKRSFLGEIEYSPLDRQGRIVLTKEHYGRLESRPEVAIIGSGDHFEIWAQDEWDRYADDEGEVNKAEMWDLLTGLGEGEA